MKTPYNTPVEKSAVNPMCPSCARFGADCDGTTCKTWTGCVYKRHVPADKAICKPRLIYQPDATPDMPYNVQLWHSYDGGKTFWYAGCGRFFNDYHEAEAWRKQQRKNLAYDLMFGCLGNGTTVCNLAREEHGDYQKVAHIDDCGAISWYLDVDRLPPYVREDVEAMAARDAAAFREKFMKLDRFKAFQAVEDRFLMVMEDGLSGKTVEQLYETYIAYVCKYHKRAMPAMA